MAAPAQVSVHAEDSASITHPKAIAELKRRCDLRGTPLEKMRFFVGQNCRKPRASNFILTFSFPSVMIQRVSTLPC